jgi:hypothetical protein
VAVDFTVNDVIHKINARFVRAFLPGAKKKYYLRAAFQPELDIHGIASKAEVYNITASPKVIEEGLKAGMELIYYLAADGYKIKTPVFNLNIRLPGEYDGSETRLNEDAYPEVRMQTAHGFREYIRNKVQVEFAGTMAEEGCIAGVTDETTGNANQTITAGNIIAVRGSGLKVDGDEAHKGQIGVFFEALSTGKRYKAAALPVNEPRRLKILVPQDILKGKEYRLVVVTQTHPGGRSGRILKELREVHSDFALAV